MTYDDELLRSQQYAQQQTQGSFNNPGAIPNQQPQYVPQGQINLNQSFIPSAEERKMRLASAIAALPAGFIDNFEQSDVWKLIKLFIQDNILKGYDNLNLVDEDERAKILGGIHQLNVFLNYPEALKELQQENLFEVQAPLQP
jgi:hypothetical protein